MRTITRAIPGTLKRCSVTFSDGESAVLYWGHLLKGGSVHLGWLRHDTVRPSSDGLSLLIDHHQYRIPGIRQAPDATIAIPLEQVEAVARRSKNSMTKVFQVQGADGPMTVKFLFLNRAKNADPATDPHELTQEEVQAWYTSHGFPKGGTLQTADRRSRVKALWQMV